ncbi:MAG: SPOR domain-containing protein [Rhodospirillales bacterium]|nr:SPOR domain-containing protein [Rhodospirillales bacterium]
MPVRLATWAINGVSYVTTEKSITDHGLTAIAKKDCAVWRGLVGNQICTDSEEPPVVVATIETKPEPEPDISSLAKFETAAGGLEPPHPDPIADEVQIVSGKPENVPVPDKRAVFVPAPRKPTFQIPIESMIARAKAKPSPAMELPPRAANLTTAGVFFVIGSFAEIDNATSLMNRHGDLDPVMVTAKMDGRDLYRVAVGPFGKTKLKTARRVLTRAGIFDAWAIRMNATDWTVARGKRPREDDIASLPK